ncbi:TPA: prepilin-type N-terminal cleavage/methylation domain-containing protein, partial [Candidatus Galligastranaerophilus intestinigallinarum]|nr:prepilin-type N-terminal cleavage/methylation domain-containing protein [Candidatus Galligastranaerophilus intestinigallinarum]
MKGNLIMKKSLGFTLAEVLITLAIIGVVAAMTIPS